jgi:hypothetical protein
MLCWGIVIGDFYQSSDYSMIAHKNQINAIIVRDPLEELPILNVQQSQQLTRFSYAQSQNADYWKASHK